MKAPECTHDEQCMMCTGEACNLCGAGCWNNGIGLRLPRCDHDVDQRHEPANFDALERGGDVT